MPGLTRFSKVAVGDWRCCRRASTAGRCGTMTPAQGVLAFWMLVTGSVNTLSTKFADMQCV